MSINKTIPGEIGTFNTMIASGPVIIQKRDGVFKTLLVKHGDKTVNELKWKFCGGKIVKGMSLEENAIREAKEEIGVTVTLSDPILPMILWNETPESSDTHPQAIILVHYLATITDEPIQGTEILKMEWFPLDQLPPDTAPNVLAVIKEFQRTQA